MGVMEAQTLRVLGAETMSAVASYLAVTCLQEKWLGGWPDFPATMFPP